MHLVSPSNLDATVTDKVHWLAIEDVDDLPAKLHIPIQNLQAFVADHAFVPLRRLSADQQEAECLSPDHHNAKFNSADSADNHKAKGPENYTFDWEILKEAIRTRDDEIYMNKFSSEKLNISYTKVDGNLSGAERSMHSHGQLRRRVGQQDAGIPSIVAQSTPYTSYHLKAHQAESREDEFVVSIVTMHHLVHQKSEQKTEQPSSRPWWSWRRLFLSNTQPVSVSSISVPASARVMQLIVSTSFKYDAARPPGDINPRRRANIGAAQGEPASFSAVVAPARSTSASTSVLEV